MSVPVILDCDPGHDDAFAILAAGSPLADLRAITTVAGNGTLEAVTQNALKVCTLAGIRDIPVAAGAAGPLRGELHTRPTSTARAASTDPTSPTPTSSWTRGRRSSSWPTCCGTPTSRSRSCPPGR